VDDHPSYPDFVVGLDDDNDVVEAHRNWIHILKNMATRHAKDICPPNPLLAFYSED
jgi:hypothetical protein